jgi:secreted trypsin-like serine protease
MSARTQLIASLIVLFCIASSSVCEECGKQKSAHQLVYGGTATSPAQWPWLVPLLYKANNEFFCTANLISHQHILTGKYSYPIESILIQK